MVYKNRLNPSEVGERIRQIRGIRTLEEFAEELGVKNPTIYRYETDRIPDAEMLAQIAELASVSVDWLLTGKNAQPHVSDIGSAYGKDRDLINVIRDVKRVWLASDETARQMLRDVIRGLKRIAGLG